MSILYFFFVFGLQTIFAYDLKQIDHINDTVKLMEMDNKSNMYIVTYDNVFYKLNSNYELLLSKNFTYILKIIITPLNYAWIITINDIFIVKPNSTEVHHATSHVLPYRHNCYKDEWLIDSIGNLIYNSGYQGVAMMKFDAITPILIVNLEDYYMSENSYVLDPNTGHVCFIVAKFENNTCSHQKSMIYTEDLDDLAPKAQINNFEPFGRKIVLKHTPSFLSKFGDDEFVVGYSGEHARLTTWAYNVIYDSRVIFSQPSFEYSNFHSVNDHFYFFGKMDFADCYLNIGRNVTIPGNDFLDSTTNDSLPGNTYMYYTSRYTPRSYKIKQIKMADEDLCSKETRVSFDSFGNMFMATAEKLYRLDAGGDEVHGVPPFDVTANPEYSSEYSAYRRELLKNKILDLAMDKDDNLWILGRGELFLLGKNLRTAERMTNSSFISDKGVLRINDDRGEVLVGCDREASEDDTYLIKDKGLYVFHNNVV